MQSMKEKWLGFATDENVVRALKDIRRVGCEAWHPACVGADSGW